MLKEFREFAMRGNVIDLAVGVIIGAAFGKITASLVGDVVMPPIGWVLGRIDFSNLYVNLSATTYASLADAKQAGAPVIAYGAFINSIIEFVIVAFAVFVLVKQVNRLRAIFERQTPPVSATERPCPLCLSAIPIAARKCRHCTADLPA